MGVGDARPPMVAKFWAMTAVTAVVPTGAKSVGVGQAWPPGVAEYKAAINPNPQSLLVSFPMPQRLWGKCGLLALRSTRLRQNPNSQRRVSRCRKVCGESAPPGEAKFRAATESELAESSGEFPVLQSLWVKRGLLGVRTEFEFPESSGEFPDIVKHVGEVGILVRKSSD